MRKRIFGQLVFSSSVLLLLNCSGKDTVYSLLDETKYAQIQERYFTWDYLGEETPVFKKDGWSAVRENGTRGGAYPQSTLTFALKKRQPLYLYCKCKPSKGGKRRATAIHITVNKTVVAKVELKPNAFEFLKIPIPSQLLQLGKNTVVFSYETDHNKEEPLSQEKEKREFSAIFHKLILTSQRDFKEAVQAEETRLLLRDKYKNAFIQRVPGTVDFYLKFFSQPVLSARYRFIPLKRNKLSKNELSLHISVQKLNEEPKTVCHSLLGQGDSLRKLEVDLKDMEGISRIRLSVQGIKNRQVAPGFVVWEKALIVAGKTRVKRPPSNDGIASQTRETLLQKNAIIVVFDAARPDHFSNYGYFRPTTPHVSKFAKEAVVFHNAFSESLTTRPSTATLFTGLPVEVTSIQGLFSKLPKGLTTLAQLFKERGFKTAGMTGVGNISSEFNFDMGFDEYYDLFKEEGFFRKSRQYLPYLFSWLERNKHNRFFLYVHFKEPHAVYIPESPFQGMFSEKYKKKVDLTQYHEVASSLSEEEVDYIRACYDENLASADAAFGELIDKLKEWGLLEKSIVILTADHGEFLGEQGRIFGHGRSFADYGIRIPLLIRFPKETPGIGPQRKNALVKTSDIFASLADIYQFDINPEVIEGRSVLSLLTGATQEINSYIISGNLGTDCYRTLDKKIVFQEESGELAFFDLTVDPEERHNLYGFDNIMANYLLAELKRWKDRQRLIKRVLLIDEPVENEIQLKNIDRKTIENLRALGYIK